VACRVAVDGAVVLDKTLWDDIDRLWVYVGGMLVSLRKDAEASRYFPDRPIKLAFKRLVGGWVLVTLQGGSDRYRRTRVRRCARPACSLLLLEEWVHSFRPTVADTRTPFSG
jgi:hypothetical protein